MRGQDADPEHVHSPPTRLRWPERVANMLNGAPLAFVVMLLLGSCSWAQRLPSLAEVIIGTCEMAISLLLVAALEVGMRRAEEPARRSILIALYALLLQPAWAGALRLMDPVKGLVLNLLNQVGLTDWTVTIALVIVTFLCLGLLSWLIIVISRRATAYILPTTPPPV